jgi:YHS domain-containing protein
MVKDVVCGMEVNEGKASFESEYEGRTYRFCSAMCKTKFERNPAQYVK